MLVPACETAILARDGGHNAVVKMDVDLDDAAFEADAGLSEDAGGVAAGPEDAFDIAAQIVERTVDDALAAAAADQPARRSLGFKKQYAATAAYARSCLKSQKQERRIAELEAQLTEFKCRSLDVRLDVRRSSVKSRSIEWSDRVYCQMSCHIPHVLQAGVVFRARAKRPRMDAERYGYATKFRPGVYKHSASYRSHPA